MALNFIRNYKGLTTEDEIEKEILKYANDVCIHCTHFLTKDEDRIGNAFDFVLRNGLFDLIISQQRPNYKDMRLFSLLHYDCDLVIDIDLTKAIFILKAVALYQVSDIIKCLFISCIRKILLSEGDGIECVSLEYRLDDVIWNSLSPYLKKIVLRHTPIKLHKINPAIDENCEQSMMIIDESILAKDIRYKMTPDITVDDLNSML